jgi:hypothetical protein
MVKMTREEFDENFARVKRLSSTLNYEEKDWLIILLMIVINYPDGQDPLKAILTDEENTAFLSIMGKLESLMAEEEG